MLKEFGWFNQSKWLDVRGNHDAFVHYPEPHPYKLHMVYGVAGKSSVYSHTVTTSSGKLRFIGIDANGPLFRHFNGFITRDMLDALEHLFQSESYAAFSIFLIISTDSPPSYSPTTLYSPWICEHDPPKAIPSKTS